MEASSVVAQILYDSQRLLSSESNGMDSSSSQRHRCAKLELLSTSEQKEGVHHD